MAERFFSLPDDASASLPPAPSPVECGPDRAHEQEGPPELPEPPGAADAAAGGRQRWVHSQQANVLLNATIIVNALVLGIEVDHRPDVQDPLSQPVWFTIDSTFNVIFLVECLLRIEAERASWHREPWNWLDAVLVIFGVADVWVIGLLGASGDVRVFTVARIFRLLRLTRILRVLRLFRFLRELLLLMNAIFGAVLGMVWSLLLLGVVLVITALFTTRLVGQECCTAESDFPSEKFGERFGTVPRSLFTLFQVTTLENWPDIAREALTESPLFVISVILFILFANITLLNTVAGIVVETVLSCAQREEAAHWQALEERQRRKLREIFDRMDTDQDGTLTWGELQRRGRTRSSMITMPSLRNSIRRTSGVMRFLLPGTRGCTEPEPNDAEEAGLSAKTMLEQTLEHANMSALDAKELFRLLDTDGSGTISKAEFVDTVTRASMPPTAFDLLHVSASVSLASSKLRLMASRMDRVQEQLRAVSERARARQAGSSHARRGFALEGPCAVAAAAAAELAGLQREMKGAFAAAFPSLDLVHAS